MTLRLFVGVFPPTDIQDAIASVHESLSHRPRGRWVRPEHLHLTLCFLGDCPREAVGELCAALDRTAARHACFDLLLHGLGAFPSVRRARVAYVAATEGHAALSDVAQTLRDELNAELRPADDKPFRAHLTLARFRDTPAKARWAALDAAYAAVREPWRVRVAELRLVESTLSAQGPRYRPLHLSALSEA